MKKTRRFSFVQDVNDIEVQEYLKRIKVISTLKVSKLFSDLNIYSLLNRPRSPEEVFHIKNYSELDNEFVYLFELLANMGLLKQEGEFYKESDDRIIKEKKYEEFIAENPPSFVYVEQIFDRTLKVYKTILDGEQGKLGNNEFIRLLDNIYGSEFLFMLRELFFKNISTRTSLLSFDGNIDIVNWGVGSGYDAVHIADFFGERASVLSFEPDNECYRGQVLQDIYECYHLDFFNRSTLQVSLLEGTVDLLFAPSLLFMTDLKEVLPMMERIIKDEGYLALMLSDELMIATNWVLSIFKEFNHWTGKVSLISKFKHYGFSRIKYVGLNDGFVLLQK